MPREYFGRTCAETKERPLIAYAVNVDGPRVRQLLAQRTGQAKATSRTVQGRPMQGGSSGVDTLACAQQGDRPSELYREPIDTYAQAMIGTRHLMQWLQGRVGGRFARVLPVAAIVKSLPPHGLLLFQANWYLETYEDVRAAGVDPLAHFLNTGAGEGRRPNPYFWTDWYADRHLVADDDGDAFHHYLSVGRRLRLPFNPIHDPAFIAQEYGLAADEDPLYFLLAHPEVDRVAPWFSRSAYRAFNPDVSEAGVIPEFHLLDWGLQEQRLIGPSHFLTSVQMESQAMVDLLDPDERVYEFTWSGQLYRVTATLISQDVLGQISGQADIDPDVVAAGVDALPSLRQTKATDIDARIKVNYRELLEEVPPNQEAVILVPHLVLGGADKYTANLVWGLKQLGLQDVLVATTQSTREADFGAMSSELLAPLRDTRVASLKRLLGQHDSDETVLASLLLRAGPTHLFVVNSDLGNRTVRRHGRALSDRMWIATTFFSESRFARGAPYSARYLRAILPYAHVISDNQVTIDKLVARAGPTTLERFHCLPTTIHYGDETGRPEAPSRHTRRHSQEISVLWLSRWEPFKAVDVLVRVAELEPRLAIDAYGPGGSIEPGAGLPAGLRRMGPVVDTASIPLDDYDMFLFTSYFEGMPIVVLEMALAGIPICASDVGGLRETFSPDAIEFVDMSGSLDQAAEAFRRAILRVWHEPEEAQRARAAAARDQVLQRHGPDAYLDSLKTLIERRA